MPPAPTKPTSQSPTWPLYLGCPVWACDGWADQIYPPGTARKDWLAWYTRTFNTVEGNSTFYALPSVETAQRWAEQSASGFRFCFKVPRSISHELELRNSTDATRTFLRCLEPLAKANRLGPIFLQLGPQFGPDRHEILATFLRQLSRDFQWAVEVRHFDWYDNVSSMAPTESTKKGHNEARLNDLLAGLGMDKVLFDSRPLYQSPPDDEIERVSQSRKPRTPVRQTVTGKRPFLRLVGRNRLDLVNRYLDQWAPIVAGWMI